jgi:hypothetical protein
MGQVDTGTVSIPGQAALGFAGWKGGEVFIVSKIMVTRDLLMVYIIGGNGYHFYLFQILLP